MKRKLKTQFDRGSLCRERVVFKLSKKDLELLDVMVKERLYPSPVDPSKLIHFESRQEYLEFCVRALSLCGRTVWFVVSCQYNPDFPKD